MWSFLLGLLMGYAAKTVYDLFKDEELPASFGLNSGRMEALMDETRQMVRDLRDEVRQAAAGEGSIPEKAGRAFSAAGETIKAAVSSATDDAGADEDAGDSGMSQDSPSRGSSPTASHGTIHTMS